MEKVKTTWERKNEKKRGIKGRKEEGDKHAHTLTLRQVRYTGGDAVGR